MDSQILRMELLKRHVGVPALSVGPGESEEGTKAIIRNIPDRLSKFVFVPLEVRPLRILKEV